MSKQALAIGVFDGVHLGHQEIVKTVLSFECPSQAITFSNHPLDVLHPALAPMPLTPLPLKTSLLLAAGIQEVIPLCFTDSVSSLSFEEFLEPYEISHLVIGEDAAIGKGRLGNVEALRLLGLKRGFEVHAVPKRRYLDEPISSTRIRALIRQGNFALAQEMLGRPHCFTISSAKEHTLLPPDGRYPVWAYSPAGAIQTTLIIENQIPSLPLERPQLVSFGPLNSTLLTHLCHQTSLAEL